MPEKRYSVIYADPPWQYEDTRGGGNPAFGGITYPTMPTAEICALPVQTLAEPDCTLFLWATMPLLPDAFTVISAWGFKYVTCAFVWVKQNPANDYREPSFFFPTDREAFNIYCGGGAWTNSNAEIVLLGRRGRPKRVSTTVKQIILAPRGRHSAKPAEVRDRIVALMGDVPRVELFARQKADGWDSWGNEVESDVNLLPLTAEPLNATQPTL